MSLASFVMFTCLAVSTPAGTTPFVPALQEQWPALANYVQELWKAPPQIKVQGDLPHPHVIPILFYWDMYFMTQGLAAAGRVDLARNIVENLIVEVERLGFVPNASAAWGQDRSQLPFLSMMVRDVWQAMPTKDPKFLARACKAVRREYDFWTDAGTAPIEDHRTTLPPLARFAHHLSDASLADLYDRALVPRLGLDAKVSYNAKLEQASNRAAEAVSGWDFTPRFEGRTLSFAAVDLNTNLWTYETNFVFFVSELKRLGNPGVLSENGAFWQKKAHLRKAAIDKSLWDETRGVFVDYDFVSHRPANVVCLSSFWPMWAGLASPEQAAATVRSLGKFEQMGGLGACEDVAPQTKRSYQWDYGTAWPHLHIIVVAALLRYGFKEQADRIAARYLDNQTKNFLEPSPKDVRTSAEFASTKMDNFAPLGRTWEKLRAATPGLDLDEYGVNQCIQVAPAAALLFYQQLNAHKF